METRPLPVRPRSPRNAYGIPQREDLRAASFTPLKNCPIGSQVVLKCPSPEKLQYSPAKEAPPRGLQKYLLNSREPLVPPSNKPFVEQDLEKLRNTTAGVAWKQEAKFYEPKKAHRPVYRLEELEDIIVREFLHEMLKSARDLKRVHHTLAPGPQEERGFDLPGGGLWTDTRAAMKNKVEYPSMNTGDIDTHVNRILSKLDIRKPEDVLYLTETDWRELNLPVNLAFVKDRLIRFMMNHKTIPALHRASFFAAQQMCQRPCERFKNLNFADKKSSAYAIDGFATKQEVLLKGEHHDVPATGDSNGWVVSDDFHVTTMSFDDQQQLSRGGSLPNMHGWPRGWPYRCTDVGTNAPINKYRQFEDRGTQDWMRRTFS
jgi:hypothetical protein